MKKSAIRSLVVMLIAVMFVSMMPAKAFAATKKPAKVKTPTVTVLSSVSKSTNMTTVKIKWKKASRATGYIIYAKQGDGPWVKQKQVGRLARSLKLKKVPAGKLQVRVRAVNKKKLGKYSNIKTKYIKSQLTVAGYIKRFEPSAQNQAIEGICKGYISYSGNQVSYNYYLEDYAQYNESLKGKDLGNLSQGDQTNLYNVLAGTVQDPDSLKKYLKNNFGLTATIVARFVYQGNVVVTRKF